MGMNITKLQPVGGFCAETAGSIALFGASALGIPVSTTHTITGAIIGSGVSATRKLSAVKWGVAGRIVWAWVLTMPAAGVVAAAVLVRHSPRGHALTRPAPSPEISMKRIDDLIAAADVTKDEAGKWRTKLPRPAADRIRAGRDLARAHGDEQGRGRDPPAARHRAACT